MTFLVYTAESSHYMSGMRVYGLGLLIVCKVRGGVALLEKKKQLIWQGRSTHDLMYN